ncbi:class I SAM-dependent methyltransferase [Fodinicola acaciae]|uniref:class I SAM-dependent methyltransferase n=1 Tax=Fodinicola acaciae TaxID=2681555 RepID=UPI0013D6C7D2|nr:class I SAM-dependent methyltransferase [Fodinicola acaciae]
MTDPYAIDWDSSRDHLRDNARNDADWNAVVASRLVRPTDRLAVDVGCGGAGMAIAIAHALPTDAAVIAIDGSAEVLEGAKENARAAQLSQERLAFRQCDLHGGLTELRAAVTEPVDLVWASASVHHVGDQQAAIDQLASLLADDGRLALAEGGLPPRRMPWDVGVGRPGLELRLDAANDEWFVQMRGGLPGSKPMPYGWTEALRRAGLREVTTFSVLIEKPAPLDANDRAHVLDSIEHRVQRSADSGSVDADDLASWQRLLDRDDPAWLGHRDDLFLLDVRSIHLGAKRSRR